TLTAGEVVAAPALSKPTAVKLWLPFAFKAVFHEIEYGAVVTCAPRFAPSSLNWTPTMPTLSAALAETVTVPATVAPAAGAVIETEGGVVSALGGTVLKSVEISDALSARS